MHAFGFTKRNGEWVPPRKPRHRKVGFADRIPDERRNAPKKTPRHRMEGPERAPTIFDMTPDEFTAVKGAGGRT